MKTFTKRILLLASILLIWDITAKHVNPLFIPEPVTVFDESDRHDTYRTVD